MDILEMARQLGQLIKDSDEMKRMDIAETAYDADEKLHTLIDEYNAQDSALQNAKDGAFTEAIQERMNSIYETVVANPVYAEYMEAQQEVQRLMHSVNDEINFVVTGHRGCSHDCEECGGGCHDEDGEE